MRGQTKLCMKLTVKTNLVIHKIPFSTGTMNTIVANDE